MRSLFLGVCSHSWSSSVKPYFSNMARTLSGYSAPPVLDTGVLTGGGSVAVTCAGFGSGVFVASSLAVCQQGSRTTSQPHLDSATAVAGAGAGAADVRTPDSNTDCLLALSLPLFKTVLALSMNLVMLRRLPDTGVSSAAVVDATAGKEVMVSG